MRGSRNVWENVCRRMAAVIFLGLFICSLFFPVDVAAEEEAEHTRTVRIGYIDRKSVV